MTRRFVVFLYCVAGLTIAIPMATLAIIGLLPEPEERVSKRLAPGITGLPELRDRVAVGVWILLTCIAGFILWCKRQSSDPPRQPSTRLGHTLPALVTLAILTALTWRVDPNVTYNIKRLRVIELLVSAGLIVAIVGVARAVEKTKLSIQQLWISLQGVVAAVVFVILFPTYFQTPSTLIDPGHFMYTSDEVLAPSVGKWPMSDYVSQYTNLLGFPITPFVHFFPDRAIAVVVAYFVLLQFLCFAASGYMAITTGQTRLVLLATTIPALICATGTYTYFQAFPLRMVLPSLILICSLKAVKSSHRKQLWLVFVGLCASLAVINNPDYGTFATLAATLTLGLTERTIRARVYMLVTVALGFFVGGLIVFGLYSMFGHNFNLNYLTMFQRVFGEAGFFNAPMALGGIPVAFVIIFGVSALTGIFALLRAWDTNSINLLAAAAQLLFASLWGLFSSVYFSGRSYSSTALSGSSFPLGLTLAALLIYVSLDTQHFLMQCRRAGQLGMVVPILGFAMLSLIVMSALRMPNPTTSMEKLAMSGTDYVVEQLWLDQLFTDDIEFLTQVGALQHDGRHTAFLLPSSNALQLKTGIKSLLVSNHPANAQVSVDVADLQCRTFFKSNTRYVIEQNLESIEGEIGYRSILQMPECQTLFGPNLRTIYLSPTLRVLENTLAKEE